VIFTADNSLFTCYSFLAEHQSDYHIVLEQDHIMKGTRNIQLSALNSEVSGEPILRPYSEASRVSRAQSVSPTFNLHNSVNEGQLKDPDEDIFGAFNGVNYIF
jgi:hypothetical protein